MLKQQPRSRRCGLVGSEGVFFVRLVILLLDLSHDWAANFTRRCLVFTLADAVVIQDTSTAETMRGLAVLISALLHVLPKRHHLSTELHFACVTCFAFASMTQQE